MNPPVFRGLWCQCEEPHYQEAAYYVSVMDGGDGILALGPFQEHYQALARVDDVRREVLAHWNPGGRADWYGYGTAVSHTRNGLPGKLNGVLGL